jgi:hypothetical protein
MLNEGTPSTNVPILPIFLGDWLQSQSTHEWYALRLYDLDVPIG